MGALLPESRGRDPFRPIFTGSQQGCAAPSEFQCVGLEYPFAVSLFMHNSAYCDLILDYAMFEFFFEKIRVVYLKFFPSRVVMPCMHNCSSSGS